MDAPALIPTTAALPRRNALRFIVLLGIVSLFADMTYESARSITGPYLALLGASATVVGFVSGFGELAGYALRLVSGYVSDRTGRYWPVTIFGYVLNLFAVPALALTGRWELAVLLIIAERMGKAIRSPARDAMLSHASSQTGLGWGFGLHEAMDQAGAITGPLILSAILAHDYGYREAFGILVVPALLSISVLLAARYLFPRPRDLDLAPEALEAKGLPPVFWVYMVAIAFIAAGYADYALIAFHFDKSGLVPAAWIPLLYAIAMASRRRRRAGARTGVRPGRPVDDGRRDPRLRRLGAAGVSGRPQAGGRRHGAVGTRHGRSGIGDAGGGRGDGAEGQAGNGLRYDEHDLWRRLVRRQRAAGRSLRPNVGALGCARLRGPAIGFPSRIHTADPTRRLRSCSRCRRLLHLACVGEPLGCADA